MWPKCLSLYGFKMNSNNLIVRIQSTTHWLIEAKANTQHSPILFLFWVFWLVYVNIMDRKKKKVWHSSIKSNWHDVEITWTRLQRPSYHICYWFLFLFLNPWNFSGMLRGCWGFQVSFVGNYAIFIALQWYISLNMLLSGLHHLSYGTNHTYNTTPLEWHHMI